jgi:hypothetical protein
MIRLGQELEAIEVEYIGLVNGNPTAYQWWIYDRKDGEAVGHIRQDRGAKYIFWPGSNRALRGPVATEIGRALEEANRRC